jgi:hypothetical protein
MILKKIQPMGHAMKFIYFLTNVSCLRRLAQLTGINPIV